MAINVLLAEDHHIIRQGIRSLLEKEMGIRVIGEAEDGRETVRLAAELQPDVVVMDISMPNLNGIEATRKICEADPDVKVIALSVHSDDQYVSGMLTAGANGYLLKDCVLEELVKAIEAVSNGQIDEIQGNPPFRLQHPDLKRTRNPAADRRKQIDEGDRRCIVRE